MRKDFVHEAPLPPAIALVSQSGMVEKIINHEYLLFVLYKTQAIIFNFIVSKCGYEWGTHVIKYIQTHH